MKQFLFILAGTVLLACNDADKPARVSGSLPVEPANEAVAANPASLTTIQWLDSVNQNLGSLTQGQVVEISWRFKNTGTQPLTITDVHAGCGCTTPDPPKEPIAPGAEGVIKAKFNSENFGGHVTKEVYVQANNSNRNNGTDNKLSFSADIKE